MPETGWPWCLTDYEMSYIQHYGVRPVRDTHWVGTAEDNSRLDQEAARVLSTFPALQVANFSPPQQMMAEWQRPPAAPTTMPQKVYWGLTTLLLAIIGVLVTLGAINSSQVSELNNQAASDQITFERKSKIVERLVGVMKERNYDLPKH